MKERKVSFKQALNCTIREGARAQTRVPFETPSRTLGPPALSLDKALQIADDLEDEEIVRKLRDNMTATRAARGGRRR